MTGTALPKLIAVGRLVVGGGALVAPRRTGRLFGIDADANPAASYVARLFGVRAVWMALLLLSSRGDEQRRQLESGVAVDLTDAFAALVAGFDGSIGRRSAVAATAAAVTEASLGLRALEVTPTITAGAVTSDRAPSPR